MVEDVIEIKSLIAINVDASAKSIIYVKNVLFEILLNLVVNVVKTHQVLVMIQ